MVGYRASPLSQDNILSKIALPILPNWLYWKSYLRYRHLEMRIPVGAVLPADQILRQGRHKAQPLQDDSLSLMRLAQEALI